MRAFMSQARRAFSRTDATYSIPLESLGNEELEDEKERLTLQAKTSFGPQPPAFHAWFEADGRFHCPLYYGLERFGNAELDARVDGNPISLSFTGTLTAVQQRATDAVCRSVHDGVVVSMPCGTGKTVWGVHEIVRLGRKACVLVHKSFLRDQWRETFERFCPGVRVGVIQGKVWDVDDCDVVIAMVMTIARREYNPHIMDHFGTICVDECHHIAAPVMNLTTRAFRARYRIGLTATKDRPDGLTPLLHWSLGPEVFSVGRQGESVSVSVALFPDATPDMVQRDGKPLVCTMVNRLAAHDGRNAFLAARAAAYRQSGRVILILSDRIAQLRALRAALILRGIPEEDVGFFTGATKEQARAVELAKPIVLCSYGMASEGLDKREADTCILATPKGRITQCVGRIQRPCATKQTPIVLDVVDTPGVFQRLRWKRQREYSREGYRVQVVRTDDPSVDWFV